MALTPPATYTDAFLAPRVSPGREAHAVADIAQLGTFPADWITRLVVLRVYITLCTELMVSSDDTFAAKLAAYSKEFTALLPQARAAQQAAEAAAGKTPTGGGSAFTVDLQRA